MLRSFTCLLLGLLLAKPACCLSGDTLNRKRLTLVVAGESGFYLGGMAYLQYVWYKDSKRVPFEFYNDNKGYLQMDKCGHMFAAYYESYAGYHLLRWAGVKHKKALLYGGPLGFVLQAPIEVFDGIYEGWGFSTGDIIANFTGSALFTVQQACWQRQIIRPKFSYAPSPYRQYHPKLLGSTQLESFFLDYNGHTYWLSAPLKEILPGTKLPPWLCVSFGYSANGMIGEFENKKYYKGNPIPHFDRYRQFLFSLDLDLTRIKSRKKWVNTLLGSVSMLKVPFPALEYNRLQGFKGYFLYY